MIWGLFIFYIFAFAGLLIYANKHGQERDPYNFWVYLISMIIQFVLIWWALGWRFF